MKFLRLFFVLLVIPDFATSQRDLPVSKPFFPFSTQAVVVTTKDWTTFQGNAQLFERVSGSSKWIAVGDSFPVVVGRNGLARDEGTALRRDLAPQKQEGDGKAPAGIFPLTFSFGSTSKTGPASFRYTKLEEFTECVDDVNSAHYNKIVNRTHVGSFDWKSLEQMLAVGPEYDLGVFVAYNSYPVKSGDGSCIFLHIWKNADSGTGGCTAMERGNLEKLVVWLDGRKQPFLIQMPKGVYKKYRKSWNLPKIR